MKKLVCLLSACALCSVFALTACSNNAAPSSAGSSSIAPSAESSSAELAGTQVAQADIEKMVIGTWITADRGGQPELTDEKVVFDIVSDTKARVSAQFELAPGELSWKDFWDADVVISGNKMTITDHPGENATAVSVFTIEDIGPDEFTANHEVVLTANGTEVGRMEDVARYIKIDVDYGKSILGTWEGHSISGDGEDFRIECKDDGTYVYYLKDGDNWVATDDTLNEYYVAGNLLCLRWVENGQENRKYWEIAIDDDTMRWNALREGDDGKTFIESCELKKVA